MKRSRGCGKNARHPRKHAEYSPYRAMLTRCYNPNVLRYKDYGGRGIEVCERWLGSGGFKNFLADVGPRPSTKHCIERRNNAEGYCPQNCCWATLAEQAVNKRNNRLITAKGKTQTLSQWSRETGLHPQTILHRLKHGSTSEESLSLECLPRKSYPRRNSLGVFVSDKEG